MLLSARTARQGLLPPTHKCVEWGVLLVAFGGGAARAAPVGVQPVGLQKAVVSSPARTEAASSKASASSDVGSQNTDVGAVLALKAEVEKAQNLTPQYALARYAAFAKSHPTLDVRAALLLCDAKAQVQLNGLNDPDAALATYEVGRLAYQAEPASLGFLAEEAKILLASGRAAEAQTRLQAQQDKLLAAPPPVSSPVFQQLARALVQQGKKDELVALLQGVMTRVPAFLDDATQSRPRRDLSLDAFLLNGVKWGWMYEKLVGVLLEQGKTDEALSWAKARAVTAGATGGAVDRANRMLAKVALAKDPSGGLAIAIVRARTPGNKEADPLAAVVLPNVAPLSPVSPSSQGEGQNLNLLLWHGDWQGAMRLACHSMATASDPAEGAQDVARVFQATDLGVGRANGWLRFARGENVPSPLPTFFNGQMPDEAKAASALSGKTPELRALEPLDGLACIVPFKVALLRAKKLLPDEAFANGALSLSEIAYMLRWGGIVDGEGQTDNKRIRVTLAGLLFKASPNLALATPDNQNLRMAVADYFREQKDPRAETMLRDLLDEGRADAPGNEGRRAWYYTPCLNRLAEFYRKMDQPQDAQALYVQEERDTKGSDAIESSVAALEAARLSVLTGDDAGARVFYAQVVRGSYGWTKGLALWDQAKSLVEKGHNEEARALLLQPVTGEGADKVQVAVQALLALSYYRTGDIDKSRQAAQASLDAFKVADVRDGRGLIEQKQSAEQLLSRIERWQKQPVQSEPGELRFWPASVAQLRDQGAFEDGQLVRTLQVRTLLDEPLEVASDNAEVKVRLFGDKTKEQYAAMSTVVVTMSQKFVEEGGKATLTLSNPQKPDHVVKVPVSSDAAPPDGVAPVEPPPIAAG